MQWRKAFEEHLRTMGDWWVKDSGRQNVDLAIAEQGTMQRKKEELRTRDAQIQKVVVQATVDRIEEKREDTVVDYHLLCQWFISQDEQFYLEERLEERQAVVRKNRVAADHLQMLLDTPVLQPLQAVNGSEESSRQGKGRIYNRLQAVRYAELWWNRRNPAFPVVENDCTNYISQCLQAGGITMFGAPIRGRGWWHQQTNWSFSWAVANSLRWYLSRSGNIIGAVERDRADKLVPGDLICYDFEGDGNWNHNTIVTALDPKGQPLVNAHTYDCRSRIWPYADSPAWTKKIQYKYFHIEDQV